VLDAGPLVATLRVESAAPGARRLARELRLVEGSDTLEVSDTLDKLRVREKESVHFSFPFRVPGGALRLDLGEALVRPEADQLAGSCKDFLAVHSSVDVSNADIGVTLTSLDAPLVEIGAITDETLGVKNVRAWRTAAAPGTTVHSYAMNNYWHTNYKADQEGEAVFRYALAAHGPASPDAIARLGLEAARPLAAIPADPAAPPPRPLFEIEHLDGGGQEPAGGSYPPPEVIVRSLKPAEDGKAVIARLYNASDTTQRVRLVRGGGALSGAFLAGADGEPLGAVAWPLELPGFATALVRIPTLD
jgi:hypothetical protein